MQADLPKTYRLTPSGRHTTISLMAGTVALWGTAIWLCGDTLNWGRLPAAGLNAGMLVPVGLLVVLIIALPLLLWSLCEELATSYTVSADGLHYQTLGSLAITCGWVAITGLRPAGDANDELIADPTQSKLSGATVLRSLHQLAVGRWRIPIYAGVEERNALLATIRQMSGLPTVNGEPDGPPAGGS